jgi:hypothetical protein
MGSLENSMSDQDLEEKFQSFVEDPLGKKNEPFDFALRGVGKFSRY